VAYSSNPEFGIAMHQTRCARGTCISRSAVDGTRRFNL